jgi:hypothetical protein
MGINKVITYSFHCESMELILEDEGKGREITNHCYGSSEFEDNEEAQKYGWKIISSEKVFCPYCSKPENMWYIEKLLKEKNEFIF